MTYRWRNAPRLHINLTGIAGELILQRQGAYLPLDKVPSNRQGCPLPPRRRIGKSFALLLGWSCFGRANLSQVTYRAIDGRRTRVEGATFEPADRVSLKLEGAAMIGYRALLMAGAADPNFIARHSEILAAVSHVVRDLVCEDNAEDYRLSFRLFGVDGVCAWAEPPAQLPREAFVMGECIAPTPERAEEVIRTTKQYLLHHGYDGRLSTAGNLAFPFTPPELVAGEAYRFNVFHLMEVEDMSRLFPVERETVK